MAIRVLLTDDHQLFRQGLRSMLANDAGIEVIGEAASGRAAVQLARQLVPNVVIIDISMPDLNGIDATRRIKERSPGIQVLALSAHADRRFVAHVLAAGASGYLLKDCAFAELAGAIRTVAAGQTYLSPRVAGIVVEGYVARAAAGAPAGPALSAREREVLQLLAEGRSTKQIATQLHTSISTIETHRRHIMQRLGLFSVAELTKYAVREGLTSPEP